MVNSEMQVKTVSATEFKRWIFRIVDEVRQGGVCYIITRYGVPVARMEPNVEEPASVEE